MAPSEITPVPYKTIGQLLASGHMFDIPLNQRSLEWGFDKMQSVWADLLDATDNNREHFMGFMVFQNSGTKAQPRYVVQDGQQRLMCLVSIAGILYRLLQDRAPGISGRQQAALFNMFYANGRPRLELDAHHSHLSELLETGHPGKPAGEERTSAVRFTKAFHQLETVIRNDLKPLTRPRLRDWVDAYIATLNKRVLYTAVSVRSPALALKIFYRLNSGGVALSQSDIAKNLAYLEAERQGVHEGEVTSRWNTLVRLVPFTSLSAFLRYWTEMKDGVTIKESELDVYLTDHCKGDVLGFLDELVSAASSLDMWWNGKPGVDSNVAEALRLLGRPALAYPLLCVLDELVTAGSLTPSERGQVSRAVERYMFRELTVGRRKTNEIREHLVVCVVALRTKGASAAVKSLAAKSSDSAFQQAFETWVTRAKTKQFYVVREIERKLSEGQASPGAGYVYTDNKKTRAWEIEHICPVAKSASLSVEVNRIGNLVLLEKSLNQACKHKDFAEKRTLYKSGRKGTHPLDPSRMSAVVGTHFPKGITYTALVRKTHTMVFGDAHIVARQRELAALAIVIWRIA